MDALIDSARALGVELDDPQVRAFRVYADELLAWNAKFNLTAITDRAEIDSRHFLDSLSALSVIRFLAQSPHTSGESAASSRSTPDLPHIPGELAASSQSLAQPGHSSSESADSATSSASASNLDSAGEFVGAGLAPARGRATATLAPARGRATATLAPARGRATATVAPASDNSPAVSSLRVLDVGAGAGFPAIPLKLACPDWSVTLLEATRKKCDFLEHLVIVLHLHDTRVIWGRAETAAHLLAEREQYDLVVARAVAELNVLAEFMLPFARVGSYCIAWKADIEAEVRAAQPAIEKLGGRLRAVHAVQVPGVDATRNLVVIEKLSPTPEAYPRREGVPSKKPLQ